MKSKLVAFAVIAAGTVFGLASQAFANTYNVNLTVGGATATGFFTGIIGNTSADIGAPFNLTLTEGPTSATLVGSNTPPGNAQVAAGNGNAVTVTDSQVLLTSPIVPPIFWNFTLIVIPVLFYASRPTLSAAAPD